MRLRAGGVESALVCAIRDTIERNGRSREIMMGGGVRGKKGGGEGMFDARAGIDDLLCLEEPHLCCRS